MSRLPRAPSATLRDVLPAVAASLVLAFGLRSQIPGGATRVDLVLLDWIPVARAPVVVGIHVDEITLAFAALAGLLLVPLLIAQIIDRARHGLSRRYPLIQVGAIAALVGVLLAGDTLILYVLWEVSGILLIALDRQRRTPSSFGPILTSHLSGYGLLLAVLILARGNSGSFHLAGTDPASWHWTIVLLVVAAAIGRIAMVWTLKWNGDGYAPAFITAVAGLSAGYLLIRMYSLAGAVLLPPFDYLLSILGGIIAMVGAVTLTRQPLPRWTSAVERSLIVDVGLVIAALGIGSPLGLAAALVGVTALSMSRLPAAVGSAGDTQADSDAIGQSIAIGTAMALPPMIGFAARALLCAAAIQATLIVLLLLVVAVTAVQVRSVIASAFQAKLLAEALKEAEQPPEAPTEHELLRALGARLAQDDQDLLDADVADPDESDGLDDDEPALVRRSRLRPSLAAPDIALLVLIIPLTLFALVPASLAALFRPALREILGDGLSVLAATRSIADGADLPGVIAVTVGLILGLIVAVGAQPTSRRAAERRSRSLLTSRRRAVAEDAGPDLMIAPVPAALEGISRGLGQLAGAIERHPIAVTVATGAIVVVLATLS